MHDLPPQDFDLLLRYWLEEPWGPWRDNLHAAIIAREARRFRMKHPNARIDLRQFFFDNPAKRRAMNVATFTQMLRGMAGGVRKHVSQAVKRPVRRRRKREGTKQ